ncbi:TPA: hypothetical protein ACH3X1_014392 [Trebouxia sp. C0004]
MVELHITGRLYKMPKDIWTDTRRRTLTGAVRSVYKEHIMEQILRWPFWDSLEDDMKRQWVVMMKASSRNKIPESLIPDKLVSHRLWTKFWNERATARKHAGLSRLKKEIDLGWVRMLAKPLSSDDGIAVEAANEQAKDMLQPVDQIKANLALGATDRHVASDTHVHLNCYQEGTMMTLAWAITIGKTADAHVSLFRQGVHEAKLRQEALEKCLNMLMWCTGHPPMEQQPMRKLPV